MSKKLSVEEFRRALIVANRWRERCLAEASNGLLDQYTVRDVYIPISRAVGISDYNRGLPANMPKTKKEFRRALSRVGDALDKELTIHPQFTRRYDEVRVEAHRRYAEIAQDMIAALD